jgi:inorganic pyrophosphatase
VTDDRVLCIVEIPKGSRNKYEYDPEYGAIKLDRMLFSSVVYPMDYGFVPDTLAEDGDPLDAMVCVGEPTFPGCRIWARPIAVFRMEDEKGRDDKLLCVPTSDPEWDEVHGPEGLPPQICDEIAHFFSIYKEPQGIEVKVHGWLDTREAQAVLASSRRRYAERHTS